MVNLESFKQFRLVLSSLDGGLEDEPKSGAPRQHDGKKNCGGGNECRRTLPGRLVEEKTNFGERDRYSCFQMNVGRCLIAFWSSQGQLG